MTPLESLETPVLPRPDGCTVPLTALQLTTWNDALKQGTRLSNMRVIVTSVRILGALNIPVLHQSIEAVIQRHESLRTRIVSIAGTPRQHIDSHCDFRLEIIDLTALPSTDAEGEAKRLAQKFIEAQIDLSVGPLFEGKLLRLSEREHVLFLGVDHMVCDGASSMILCRELWTLYNLAGQERPLSLPQIPVQFPDYAVWQQRTSEAWLTKHDAYWARRLKGAPYLKPPRDDGFNDVQRPIALRLQIPLGKALTSALRAAARRERIPLSSVVLTIITVVMSRWCNQDDFILGFVSHGRHVPELANMIGNLASCLYIRVTIHEGDSQISLLRRINLEVQAAYNHWDYGRVPGLYLKGSPGIFFNWVPAQWSPVDWSQWSIRNGERINGELERQPFPMQLPLQEMDPSFQLGFAPSDTAAGVIFTVAYRSDLFLLKTIERLFESIRLLSEDFVERPQECLAARSLAP